MKRAFPNLSGIPAPFWVALVASLIFGAFVCQKGIPALRHDWSWASSGPAFRFNLLDSASGWTVRGIGAPRAYPTDYLIDGLLYPVAWVISPAIILFVLSAATAFTAAVAICRFVNGHSPLMLIGTLLIALFNSWTYTELVAGHLLMILAFAGTLLIVSRIVFDEWDDRRDWWLILLTFQQIQFFVVTCAALAVPLLRRRAWRSVTTSLIAALPVIYGIAMSRASLYAVPYFGAWQNDQSVPFFKALQLRGYFAHYSDHLGIAGDIAAALLLATVAASVAPGISSSRWRWAAVVAFATACVAAGTRGVLAPVYAYVVWSVKASALFRELYDLVAYIMIAFLVMIACGRRKAYVAYVALAAGVAGLTSWIAAPPSQLWVAASKIPQPAVNVLHERYALFPAFQPYSLGSEGSGADPDAWLREGDTTPINEYLPMYPVAPALAKAASYDDFSDLGSLGVGAGVCRPWLRSHPDAMNAVGVAAPVSRPCITGAIAARPQIALVPPPNVTFDIPRLGSDQIFFADARNNEERGAPSAWNRLPRFVAVRASRSSFDATAQWIDATLILKQRPYFASAVGGVYTRSPAAAFQTGPLRWILAQVHGRLTDQFDHLRAQGFEGFAWWRIAPHSTLRCAGECLIVGGIINGSPSPRSAPSPMPHERALVFATYAPWLRSVRIPAGPPGMLLYRAAFNPDWSLNDALPGSTHVVVDSVFNGWLLPRRDRERQAWLIERTAAVQAALELVTVLWVAMLVWASLRPRRFRHAG